MILTKEDGLAGPISVPEMRREGETIPQSREFAGFLIYRIKTRDRIKKYDGFSDKPEIEEGSMEKIINLFAV